MDTITGLVVMKEFRQGQQLCAGSGPESADFKFTLVLSRLQNKLLQIVIGFNDMVKGTGVSRSHDIQIGQATGRINVIQIRDPVREPFRFIALCLHVNQVVDFVIREIEFSGNKFDLSFDNRTEYFKKGYAHV
jgi:hypothetical protein